MKNFSVFLLFTIAIIPGCEGRIEMQSIGQNLSIEKLSESDLHRLSSSKFYFGHQSVGGNMLDGIDEVVKRDNRIKLRVVKCNGMEYPDGPAFVHFDVGKNDAPVSKITDFDAKLRKGWGDKVDVAMFKFCFWDIRRETNIMEVFQEYKETVTELHTKFPKLKIMHFTVPLQRQDNGLRTRLKRALGGTVQSDLDNIRRNELSTMILREYQGKEPVFDIAFAEATLPSGKIVSFSQNGISYHSLAEEYTEDGGHLNDAGRKHVAEQFLVVLANVTKD